MSRSAQVRVSMEASGRGRWFERLLGELQIGCGSGMQPRSEPSRYVSTRAIGKMPGSF